VLCLLAVGTRSRRCRDGDTSDRGWPRTMAGIDPDAATRRSRCSRCAGAPNANRQTFAPSRPTMVLLPTFSLIEIAVSQPACSRACGWPPRTAARRASSNGGSGSVPGGKLDSTTWIITVAVTPPHRLL